MHVQCHTEQPEHPRNKIVINGGNLISHTTQIELVRFCYADLRIRFYVI